MNKNHRMHFVLRMEKPKHTFGSLQRERGLKTPEEEVMITSNNNFKKFF